MSSNFTSTGRHHSSQHEVEVGGGDMKQAALTLVALTLRAAPAMAQENQNLIDEKTGECTPRGVVASLIASA
jgi:hypothetical protein